MLRWLMKDDIGCYSQFLEQKNEDILHCQKRASCSKSALTSLPCCHQADTSMRSHRLLRLDGNRSAPSCQQACCKLIVRTFYPPAWCKLFRQLTASVQVLGCNESDFHKLDDLQQVCSVSKPCTQPETPQTCCKLCMILPALLQVVNKSVKFIKLQQVCENQICCNLTFADLLQVLETTCI